ncbi:MAG: hypothetical protein Q8910_00280 [Bacteroidota bacterium]|nr:hypothetical protein [Bacteroidota bacterium]
MANYQVIFKRQNGSIGSDTFTASNTQKARQAFFVCYRHDVYEILSVEVKGKEMQYRADYADENFEIIFAENDDKALKEAWSNEKEHGVLFNLFEVNDNYEEIRTIL